MNRQPSRGLVILVVSLIVLAVLGYLAYSHIRRDRAQKPPVSQYASQQIATSTLPDRFPTDLPIPADAAITQNERLTSPDGRFQETRAYTVNMTVAQVRDAYASYFEKKGWNVSDKKDLSSFAAFLATRDGLSMQVSIVAHGSSTAVTINMTLAPATTSK